MGKILFLVGLFLCVQVHAETWIVKNPKKTIQIQSANFSQETIKLKNEYLILNLDQKISPEELLKITGGEEVSLDIQIQIYEPLVLQSTSAPQGWHVENLNYQNLNKNYEGQGIIVAVLDTGVDYNHPALASKMWRNPDEIPNNKIDDDGNGLVDDYHGFDFISGTGNISDTMGHGTHCAGIIAAIKDNNSISQGIAPQVQIMAMKISNSKNLGGLSGIARAVKYATDNGAKVLSNSWRIFSTWKGYVEGPGLGLLNEAIAYAESKEVVFVAASGNDRKNLDVESYKVFPLSLPDHTNIIGVASTSLINGQEVFSNYSNYSQRWVSVVAPGQDIYSTVPGGAWAFKSGTSMAAPIVAGLVARGMSHGYSMRQAIELLEGTAEQSASWQNYVKHGKINPTFYLQ